MSAAEDATARVTAAAFGRVPEVEFRRTLDNALA